VGLARPNAIELRLESGLGGKNLQLKKGSTPASGVVSRASRLTQAFEIVQPFGACHAANVRREARRTAAGAAALPKKPTAWFSP